MAASDQLFWATGIDNAGLSADKEKAVGIFKQLSKEVISELNKIDVAFDKLKEKSNFKFANPVDKSAFESMRKQVADLGTVIDAEIKKLSNLSYQYDKAMTKIGTSASKIKTVSASDPLAPTVNNIHRSVQKADNDISYLQRIFKRGVAYLAIYGSINWVQNFAKQVVVTKGQFDQLGVAINAFINNTDKAKRLLDQVSAFAVRSPFQLLDITNSTKQLLSYGVQAKNVMGTLQMLSDIAAGSGQRIEDLTYLYGSSMTRGRVYAREMYQFASRGIPIWQVLSKELGVNTEQLSKMITKGQVGFPQLERALQSMSSAGGRYYGLSDKIAQTTYGKLSNLEDKWKVALSQIGAANEGIINSGIEMTSTLISNWEKVAETIKGVVLLAGTYKAAQIAVSVANTGKQAAYAQTFTTSAVGAASPEWQQMAAKQGLVKGSIEYQQALKKELELQVQKSTIAIASIEAEITKNKELLAEKEILIADAGNVVAAKTAEMDAAIANGDAMGVETAQTELGAAAKTKNTLETEKNAIAETLNKNANELGAAEKMKNTTQTVINTATEEANTAAKKSGAIATGILSKAWNGLTSFMKANQFALTVAAISGLIYVLYKLYERVNNVKSGEELWVETQKKLDDETQKQIKNSTDLLNVLEQETSTMEMKTTAYLKLQKIYPDLFKNMRIQNALTKDGVYWTQKITEEEEKRARTKIITEARDAHTQVAIKMAAFKSAREALKNTSPSNYAQATVTTYIANKAEQEYNQAVAYENAADKALRDLANADKAAKTANANPIKNKDYWKKQVDSLTAKRAALPFNQQGSAEWNKLTKEIDAAQKKFDIYEKPATADRKAEAARNKAERERLARERTKSDVNSRKQQIAQNNQKIIDYEAQAEQLRQEAYSDSMEKGYLHDKKVIEDEYKKKIEDIKKEQEKILKLAQQNEKYEYLNKPVKTRGVFTPTIKTWKDVPMSDKKGVSDATDAANEIRIAKQKALDTELLRQYNDYSLQKEEIDRKYEADRKALNEMRSQYEEGTPQYDLYSLRLAQNEKMRISAQTDLSFKQAKESPIYQLAYDNAAKVSRDGLWKLVDMLKEYKNVAIEAYDPEGVKTYTEEINKALTELTKKDPLEVLRRSRVELKKANEELIQSEKRLSDAQLEYNNATSKAVAEGPAVSTDTTLGVTNEGGKPKARVTSKISSVPTTQLAKATKTLTIAETENAVAKSKVTSITITQQQAERTLRDTIGDLSKSVTQVGDAMGDMTGQIVSLIGEVGTTVVSTINAFDGISDMAAGAMKTIETASVILAAVSAALQIIQKVISLFSSKSWAQKEYERLTQLNKVLSDTVSLYKELLGTAAGSDAQKIGSKYLSNLQEQKQNDYKALQDAMHLGGGLWKHTVGYNENEAINNIPSFGSIWKKMSVDLGATINSAEDLNKLSGEQLAMLKTDFPQVWAVLDDKVQNAMDDIIEKTLKLRDSENEVNETITGISFDSLKDGMDDFLLSSTTTFSEISDSFEDTMRKSILNLVKSKYLTNAMEQWYDDFAKDLGGDDQISVQEQEALKDEYVKIYNNAQDKVKNLLQIADIGLSDSNSANTIKSSFQSMSEDQADVLSAQFVAIRLNVSDILKVNKDYINKFDLVAQDITQIKVNTAFLEEIKTIISDIKTQGLKVK